MLPQKQKIAARMLAGGQSATFVANYLHKTIDCIMKWQRKPEFKAEYAYWVQMGTEVFVERLKEVMPKVASTFIDIMNDPLSKNTDKLKAAITIAEVVLEAQKKAEQKSLEEKTDIPAPTRTGGDLYDRIERERKDLKEGLSDHGEGTN